MIINPYLFGSSEITVADILAEGPVLWADAEDVVHTGTTIDSWPEKVSATNFTLNNAPTLIVNQINGLPIVRFNGSTNFISFARKDVKSYFFVGKITDRGNTTQQIFSVPISDVSSNTCAYLMDLGSTDRLAAGHYGMEKITQFPGSVYGQFVAITVPRVDDLRVNFGFNTPTNFSTNSPNTSTATNMQIGARATGLNGTVTLRAQMDLKELICFDVEVDIDVTIMIMRYFKQKYASDISWSESTFYVPRPATKYINNPLSPIGEHQFYPPAPLQDGGNVYIFSKSSGAGGVMTSTDGTTGKAFGAITDNLITATGTDWIQLGYRSGYVVKEGSTYYWIIKGRRADTTEECGVYTASSPTGPYTADPGNPLLVRTAVNTALGKGFEQVTIGDVVRPGATGTYHFFCFGLDLASIENGDLFRATASSLTSSISAQSLILPVPAPSGSQGASRNSCSVIYHGGKYVMIYAAPTPGIMDLISEMALYVAFNDDLTDDGGWVAGLGPILTVSVGTWDQRRVYGAYFLKEQDGEWLTPIIKDGKIQVYFAGHDLNNVNEGLPGLFEIDESLFRTITI